MVINVYSAPHFNIKLNVNKTCGNTINQPANQKDHRAFNFFLMRWIAKSTVLSTILLSKFVSNTTFTSAPVVAYVG